MASSRPFHAAVAPLGARQPSRWGSRTRRALGVAVVGSLAIATAVLAPAAIADTSPTAAVGKISYTSHYWPNVVSSPSGMAAAWQSASASAVAGYCNSGVTTARMNGLSNASLCGSPSNIISHVVVPFTTTAAGSWHFQVGPDYGNGSELLVDGFVVQGHWYNIWADGNLGNTAQVLDYTATLSAGEHTIEIYGAESCCDGPWSARFQLTGAAAWTALQTSPPQVSVTGLSANNTVEYGAPDPGCLVTDAFDGTKTPSPTLSALSGPRASAGIGSRTATCSYTDSRGLTGRASTAYTIVDTTGPTLAGVPADQTVESTGDSGASVSWPALTATDAVDGTLPVLCTPASGATFRQGTTTVTCSATDLSNNTSTATFAITVQDTTAPVITPHVSPADPDGANGWYTSSPTVSFDVTDPDSAVTDKSAGCDGGTVTSDTDGVTYECTATSAGGSDTNSVTVKRDMTAPIATFDDGSASLVDGASYPWGSVPAAPTCTAADTLSGPDGCTVTGYSTELGTHTLVATATDKAGNTATSSRSYTVDRWRTNGFARPIDMGGVVNTVKNGSTVPVKFAVYAGDTQVTDTSTVTLSAAKVTCATGNAEDVLEVTATGATSLRYDSTAGQFVYNWATPKTAGACYALTMTTADGTATKALFRLK